VSAVLLPRAKLILLFDSQCNAAPEGAHASESKRESESSWRPGIGDVAEPAPRWPASEQRQWIECCPPTPSEHDDEPQCRGHEDRAGEEQTLDAVLDGVEDHERKSDPQQKEEQRPEQRMAQARFE
jgi:hypothetical protein